MGQAELTTSAASGWPGPTSPTSTSPTSRRAGPGTRDPEGPKTRFRKPQITSPVHELVQLRLARVGVIQHAQGPSAHRLRTSQWDSRKMHRRKKRKKTKSGLFRALSFFSATTIRGQSPARASNRRRPPGDCFLGPQWSNPRVPARDDWIPATIAHRGPGREVLPDECRELAGTCPTEVAPARKRLSETIRPTTVRAARR